MPAEDALLRILVVYRRPLDFPDHFVVRAHEVFASGETVPERGAVVFPIKGDDEALALESARRHCLRLQLARIDRQPDDDTAIVECWL